MVNRRIQTRTLPLKLVPASGTIPTRSEAMKAALQIGALLDYPVGSSSSFNVAQGRLLLMGTEISGDQVWHKDPRAQTTPAHYVDRVARNHGLMISPDQYSPNTETSKPRIQFGEEPRMIVGVPTLSDLLSEYSPQ